MSCEVAQPAPLRCPTHDEVMSSALALLPRGRAWQSNEGGPQSGLDIGFEPGGYLAEGFSTDYRAASILWRFWAAVSAVFTFINHRLCDLRLEFWCATQRETNDLWLAEFGLPDACDPYPDLCAKVAAFGGARCEFYQFIAARAGWSLTCAGVENTCGSRVGDHMSRAGIMHSGAGRTASLRLVVDLGDSPAFHPARNPMPMAGRFRAGQRAGCMPDIGPLECIMARVVHAHLQILYEVTND